MKKVILIIPKDKTSFEPLIYPPLGILYIAAVLEKEGFDVSIFDKREGKKIEEVEQAEYYGFTSTTFQIKEVLEDVEFLRKEYSSSFIFAGGPHISWKSEEVKKYFDALFIGEADFTVSSVLKEKIYGIFNCSKDRNNIDLIPFPARHLLKRERVVSSKLWGGERYSSDIDPIATTIITSRGCPGRCSFCANIPQRIRFRSVENVIREIDNIVSVYGCKHYRFLDDNFLTNAKRILDFYDCLKERKIEYRCSARSDTVSYDICKVLYDTGCRELGIGVEVADDNILKLIRKRETVEIHENAIKYAKQSGLRVKIFMMAGLPGETKETIEKNKQFILRTKPDKVIITLFAPYPGCDINMYPEKYDVKIEDIDWDKYFQTYPAKSLISCGKMSSEDLTNNFEDMIKFLVEYNKNKDE